jgi:hypothetical protein
MNRSFFFLAQYENPEGGSVQVLQVTMRQTKVKNEFQKIRNAETGKSAREKMRKYSFSGSRKT